MANADHSNSVGTLNVRSVSKRYGGVIAVDQASLTIRPGSVSGLIGPNGAGKSTMVGIVTGFIRPDDGHVYFEDQDITELKVAKRNRIGIARTFQQATPLVGLSVLENVLVGMTASYRGGTLGVVIPLGGLRHQERHQREQARQILDEFGLAHRADSNAVDLPFGQLRFLDIARAMATKPSILLLDEPAAGLNRVEMTQLSGLIANLTLQGVGILVIDHDVPFVFGLCEQITVMDYGRVIAKGRAEEIENDSAVRAAYLSTENVRGGVVH